MTPAAPFYPEYDPVQQQVLIAVQRRPGVVVLDLGVEAAADAATAFDYRIAASMRVINDHVGEHPVAVFVNPETRDIKVYLRRVALKSSEQPAQPTLLSFKIDPAGIVLDQETGSVWDITRIVAIDGPLKDTLLQQIPYVTSFDWAWLDFFPPHSVFYAE